MNCDDILKSNVPVTVGDRIRLSRIAIGFSQTQLGERVGVSYTQIKNWENGYRIPKLESLRKIASALGLPVTDFI